MREALQEYVELEDSGDLQFSGHAFFTIEMWVMPSSQGGEQTLVSKYNRGKSGQYFVRCEPDGGVFFHREVAPWGQRTLTTLPLGMAPASLRGLRRTAARAGEPTILPLDMGALQAPSPTWRSPTTTAGPRSTSTAPSPARRRRGSRTRIPARQSSSARCWSTGSLCPSSTARLTR
eukprot:scaffold418_cov386-Prasinococcus_capsulatus_cf.AAC.12